jgi:hypothetical protein
MSKYTMPMKSITSTLTGLIGGNCRTLRCMPGGNPSVSTTLTVKLGGSEITAAPNYQAATHGVPCPITDCRLPSLQRSHAAHLGREYWG